MSVKKPCTLDTMRAHLFDALDKLGNGGNETAIAAAHASANLARVLVDSAVVELDYIELQPKAVESAFLAGDPHAPASQSTAVAVPDGHRDIDTLRDHLGHALGLLQGNPDQAALDLAKATEDVARVLVAAAKIDVKRARLNAKIASRFLKHSANSDRLPEGAFSPAPGVLVHKSH